LRFIAFLVRFSAFKKKDFENPPMMMSYGFGNQSMGLIMHDCGLSLIKSYKKSEMF